MKVICAGMSKCGTKSMHFALEELGYGVHDFPESYMYYETEYSRIVEKGWTIDDFYRMYKDVDAVVDNPNYYFWEEILEAFPESKVILMTRDSEDIWYRSIKKQLLTLNGFCRYYYQILSPTWRRFWAFATNKCNVAFGCKYRGNFDFSIPYPPDIVYKLIYRKHIAHVMHSCPRDRLLIYDCKEGWKPLCEFLNKPIPEKPFPWINKDSELSNAIWQTPFFIQARKEMLTNLSFMLFGLLGVGIYFTKK